MTSRKQRSIRRYKRMKEGLIRYEEMCKKQGTEPYSGITFGELEVDID